MFSLRSWVISAFLITYNTAFAAQALSTGESVDYKALAPGKSVEYTVKLNAGDLVGLAIQTDNRSANLIVKSPTGTALSPAVDPSYSDTAQARRFVAPATGEYLISVINRDKSDPADFRLNWVAQADQEKYAVQLQQFDQWLNEVAMPFKSSQDWSVLDKSFAQSKIIALGEASHGNRDEWDAKLSLVLYLAKKYKIHSVAYEIAHGAGALMDDYVQGRSKTTFALRHAIGYDLWKNDGFFLFLNGIRDYNQKVAEDQRIVLSGIDIHPVANDNDLVKDYIKTVAPALKDQANKVMDDDRMQAIWQRLQGKVSDAQAAQWENWVKEGTALQAQFDEHQADWIKQTGTQSYQSAYLALQSRIGAWATFKQSWLNALRSREKALANNITFLQKTTLPNTPIVLLMHDMHIAKLDYHLAGKKTGAYLRDQYGADYLAIGSTFAQGKFLAMRRDYRGAEVFDASSVQPESFNAYLARAKEKQYLLDLRKPLPEPARNWFGSPLNIRMIGMDSNRDVQNIQYENLTPTMLFDVVLFRATAIPAEVD